MIQKRRVAGILVAAGESRRMGFDKLFFRIDGKPVLQVTLEKLDNNKYIDELVIVAGENIDKVKQLVESCSLAKPYKIVKGGKCRAESAAAGVRACENAEIVAIHDAARPMVSQNLINEVISAAEIYSAVAPALPVKDTIKKLESSFAYDTVPRNEIIAVQTPQVFNRKEYLKALEKLDVKDYEKITDDCMVMEKAGFKIYLVDGDENNIKITTPADLPESDPLDSIRIGHGYDVHAFAENRKLILGGVTIPYAKGLMGNSDADVLLHAICDALFGAAAMGDIGRHFPDTGPEYHDADSLELLKKTSAIIHKQGYRVGNVDATVLCQSPKLAKHIHKMRSNIAGAIGINEGSVSVKATTEEGLGFTGRREGIAAHCVAIIRKL